MLTINGKRLLDDLKTLRRFGACGKGVVRPSFSAADLEARNWLKSRFAQAGLVPFVDGVGNVFGETPGVRKSILVGSHSDTQPEGGWLDGAMGVIYALEIARSSRELGISHEIGVDVVSWMDEEGTFVHSLGSRAFCDCLHDGEVENAVSAGGERLTDAIRRSGFSDAPIRRLDRQKHIAYLEGHIEQGPILDEEGLKIGVVTSIVGAREYFLTIRGEQNHAGTTPMRLRKDAGMVAFHFAAELDRRYRQVAADEIVWTFGHVSLKPNAASIVPGEAVLSIQFRCGNSLMLDRFESEFRTLLQATEKRFPQLKFYSVETIRFEPSPMHPLLQDYVADAAKARVGDLWKRMPSGAGHDAQFFCDRIPTGMVFVPSIAGVSHSFDEETAEDDIVLGCQVLADVVERMIRNKVFL